MIVKDISFDKEARERLISGVNKIADAVKSTLGARGKTVLIESENHVGGVTITKDGVTVAKSINLLDPNSYRFNSSYNRCSSRKNSTSHEFNRDYA